MKNDEVVRYQTEMLKIPEIKLTVKQIESLGLNIDGKLKAEVENRIKELESEHPNLQCEAGIDPGEILVYVFLHIQMFAKDTSGGKK